MPSIDESVLSQSKMISLVVAMAGGVQRPRHDRAEASAKQAGFVISPYGRKKPPALAGHGG
jgi:hypothetical protein